MPPDSIERFRCTLRSDIVISSGMPTRASTSPVRPSQRSPPLHAAPLRAIGGIFDTPACRASDRCWRHRTDVRTCSASAIYDLAQKRAQPSTPPKTAVAD